MDKMGREVNQLCFSQSSFVMTRLQKKSKKLPLMVGKMKLQIFCILI